MWKWNLIEKNKNRQIKLLKKCFLRIVRVMEKKALRPINSEK
jgi:hypothetical protein